ncbi:MAG: hypothetical protein ABUL67_03470 [Haliangium ochraceum]
MATAYVAVAIVQVAAPRGSAVAGPWGAVIWPPASPPASLPASGEPPSPAAAPSGGDRDNHPVAPADPPAAALLPTTPTPASPAAAPNAVPPPPPEAGVAPTKDELPRAGYLPGYRRAMTLGLSAYAPPTGAMVGGVTPAFGAPTPPSGWSFKWNGFLSASLQSSIAQRPQPLPGQSATVFHVPAQTLDEYASFVGTSTMPGTWAALNFEYGNKVVSANFSINTWNPSQPSTYYQIGSQYFINNAFLTFNVPTLAGLEGLNLRANVGYFYNTYGSLSQYGLGMYQNSVIGSPRGIGETIVAEYAVNPAVSIIVEDGLLGNRNGMVPGCGTRPEGDPCRAVVGNSGNGGTTRTSLYPSNWIHHLHLGVVKKGAPFIRAQVHYMVNWAQDDRSQMATDNPTTRDIDESYVRDGSIRVIGVDASVSHNVWGYLGAAAAHIKGQGDIHFGSMLTYGGDGVSLTDKWWGPATHGTGTLAVAGINYSVSLGKIVAHPTPFNGDGPDLLISTGFVIAKSSTSFELFDRTRHKYGLDVLYKFLPWLGAGLRGDRVAPTSRDSGETFHVIAPRLMWKSDWQSRETITLVYAKWFYGPRSHPEASSSTVAPGQGGTGGTGGLLDRIDDQLVALNVSMWW